MKGSYAKIWCFGLAGMAMLATGIAQAQDDDNFLKDFFGSIGVGGFLQLETGIRLTSEENPFNVGGNPFNSETVQRRGALPAFPDGVTFNDTKRKEVPPVNNDFNLTIVRTEVDVEWPIFSNVRLKATARGIFDVDRYDNIDDPQGDGNPPFNSVGILNKPNGPNLFEYRYDSCTPNHNGNDFTGLGLSNQRTRDCLQGENSSSPLEFAGQDYMLDFPTLYLDINYGPLLVRVGNQQIAWGDAIFFRVLDVPNALDLRRHSLLDFVAEEFSDKRVPALGIRTSLTAPSPFFFLGAGDWEYDAFVQRFRSTIFGNPNTPYNVIAAEFTVHDHFKDVDDKVNYGIRIKGPLGPVTLQFIAARKYNPNGVFHWTKTGVEEGLPGVLPNVLQTPGGDTVVPDILNAVGNVTGQLPGGLDGGQLNDLLIGGTLGAATGAILAESPFEVDPSGVLSGAEFSFGGGIQRLDHFNAVNEVVENFPAVQALGAMRAESNQEQLRQEDLFFQLSDGLRGHVARDYFRENNFGFGVQHVFSASPGSIFDQLIGSIEAKYTPNRVFTPIDLSPERNEFIESSETEVALVFTKFQRFTQSFPATFLVLQYLYRSDSDIFGRNLKGYGGQRGGFPGAAVFDDDVGRDDPDAQNDDPGSFNAIAFAFQQPFPNRVYVVDFATLLDVQGGILVQPSLTWKPNAAFKVQGFVNFIDTIYGNNNSNAVDTVDFADELTLRLSYQF